VDWSNPHQNYLLEFDTIFGCGVCDSDELVMLLGTVALSCGIGVLVLDAIFGCGVCDSNEDELILLEAVTGI
jgi:hypothetical protein